MKKKFLIIFISIFFVLTCTDFAFAAGSYSFDPASSTINVNDNLQIKILINPGSDTIVAADAVVQYDPNIFEVISVTDGKYFDNFNSVKNYETNKIFMSGSVNSVHTPKSGSGVFAIITFKAKTAGSTTLTFICTGTTGADSDIMKDYTSNILSCSQVGSGSYTVTSDGTQPTATPGAGQATNTPSPSKLPSTATTTQTIFFLMLGILLTVAGLVLTL